MAYSTSTTTGWQANTDNEIPWRTIGATELVESTTLTSSAAADAVFTGKGLFMIELTVSTLTLGSGFDTVNFMVQRNTAGASTTWLNIGQLCLGDATGIGVAQGADVYSFPVNNTGDNQIRIYAYVNGSAVNCTYQANIYPLRSKEAA